jgi:hypothetical protein
LFPHDEGFGGAGNKNPSGAVSSEEFENVEHLKWDQPISPPRESARASTFAQPNGLCVVSAGWMNAKLLLIVLSRFFAHELPQAKGRVYDRGSWQRQGEKRDVANFVLEAMRPAPTFVGVAFNQRDACGDGNSLSKPCCFVSKRSASRHACYDHTFQLELGHAGLA